MLGLALAVLTPLSMVATEKEEKDEDIKMSALASSRMIFMIAPSASFIGLKSLDECCVHFYKKVHEFIVAVKGLEAENQKYTKIYRLLIAVDKENLSEDAIEKKSLSRNLEKNDIRRLQFAIWLRIFKIVGEYVTVKEEGKHFKLPEYVLDADKLKLKSNNELFFSRLTTLKLALDNLNTAIKSKRMGKTSLAYVNTLLGNIIVTFLSNTSNEGFDEFIVSMRKIVLRDARENLLTPPSYVNKKGFDLFKKSVNKYLKEVDSKEMEKRKVIADLEKFIDSLERSGVIHKD
jgi:hypothetical protein